MLLQKGQTDHNGNILASLHQCNLTTFTMGDIEPVCEQMVAIKKKLLLMAIMTLVFIML